MFAWTRALKFVVSLWGKYWLEFEPFQVFWVLTDWPLLDAHSLQSLAPCRLSDSRLPSPACWWQLQLHQDHEYYMSKRTGQGPRGRSHLRGRAVASAPRKRCRHNRFQTSCPISVCLDITVSRHPSILMYWRFHSTTYPTSDSVRVWSPYSTMLYGRFLRHCVLSQMKYSISKTASTV